MTGIIGSVLGILGPVILWFLKQWVQSMALTEQQRKNYYAFLEDVDKHTKVDVANYVAAGNARQATIDKIIAQRKELGIDAKAQPLETTEE